MAVATGVAVADGAGVAVRVGVAVAVAVPSSPWPEAPSDERRTKYAVIVRSTDGVMLPLPVRGQSVKGMLCPAAPNVVWKWLTHQPADARDE